MTMRYTNPRLYPQAAAEMRYTNPRLYPQATAELTAKFLSAKIRRKKFG